ncbi:MAG: 2Fe-2S iron-sulfur cluster-binding protein [bacterium]
MTLFIDGKKIEAADGQTVLEAIYKAGLELAHFCWHPALSISGNCRMCLVEIGTPKMGADNTPLLDENGNYVVSYIPKLQIACATPATNLMHINASSEKVLKARKAIMEFLLINHPLDCPICDEAGECKLQEYAYKHSIGESRFTEEKEHKPKRVAWSDKIMYDGERCIMCSRCIRFAKEVAGQDVLTFVNRGDKIYIDVEKGQTFDNPLSMNVIDICPVGALTSRDFRFKSRVWEMSFGNTISPHDSTGSNIHVGTKKNQILRISASVNPKANEYWISNDVRLDYKKYEENRLVTPKIKGQGVLWNELYQKAADELKKFKPEEIFVLCSPIASMESNYALIKFAVSLGTKGIGFFTHFDETAEEGRLIVKDKSPNLCGLLKLGLSLEVNNKAALELPERMKKGEIKAVIILEEGQIENLEFAEFVLDISSFGKSPSSKDTYQAPAATAFESEGTFVNKDSLIQHFTPIIETKSQRASVNLGRWDKFGADNDSWSKKNIIDALPSWKIIAGIAQFISANWNFNRAEDVFDELKVKYNFSDLSYKMLDDYKGFNLDSAADEKPEYIYKSHIYKP